MNKPSIKHYTLGILALSASLLVGCLGAESAPGTAANDEFATLSVAMNTGKLNAASKSGGLSKANAITLSKLVVTLTSNATPADTIRDTIAAGSNGFSSNATSNQTVEKSYNLKALRTWKINAKTLDANDSVIHTKTDSVVRLLAGDSVSKSLNLTSRFVMYKASFNFPDSLASVTGPAKQKINVTRLLMLVDGDTVVDSSAAFAASTVHSINYDYVPVDVGTVVELSVIGNLSGWSFPADSALYRKTDIAITGQATGVDSTRTVALPYVGPVTGKVDLSLTIQKVGLYEITATTINNPVPKTSK